MTRKFKLSVCLLAMAGLFNAYSLYADNVPEGESEEGGSSVVCRCQKGFLTNNKCLASNTSTICAQSENGGNVLCQEYNSNCH